MSLNHSHVSHLVNETFQSINQDRSIHNVAEAEERAWGTVNRRRLRGDWSLEAVAAELYLFARLTAVRKLRSGYLAVRKARASANVREPNQTALLEADYRAASGRLVRVDPIAEQHAPMQRCAEESGSPMDTTELIGDYAAGPQKLRDVILG